MTFIFEILALFHIQKLFKVSDHRKKSGIRQNPSIALILVQEGLGASPGSAGLDYAPILKFSKICLQNIVYRITNWRNRYLNSLSQTDSFLTKKIALKGPHFQFEIQMSSGSDVIYV